ncbi:Undecaprenyl phosphate-alpha-4-amino-4-deoxy-L-arabinose arabinosyl transferase [Hartmannibacter diazotrophicus]|uniref:Undecaprenyl phosphate-alpha-4-amino-4-deoxy-L-arabinose arabinosyl transferase n=1 Tax=Hartmannibacter diazotrophicus TaxID=1482074 RepID=A0A2C9D5W7_9HYPH|nr:glycosyltransferase family 39 protein [Hartmannibacter diazotrophicus]SON55559.1 Undecaprenyl phosphate-alpha-4-amino-4-deoxy-L-arabinose arabinosyl transferase [Hartmannibacter diazotrophicus]
MTDQQPDTDGDNSAPFRLGSMVFAPAPTSATPAAGSGGSPQSDPSDRSEPFRLGGMTLAPPPQHTPLPGDGTTEAAVEPMAPPPSAEPQQSKTEEPRPSPAPRKSRAKRVLIGTRTILDLALLAVFAILLLAPGISSLPVTDRDEARFVQATKQMIASGDYVDIRFQDEPRYQKPVGIYWLQAGAIKALGYDQNAPLWAYRLPSLIAMVVSVMLVYLIGAVLSGSRVGTFAAIVFALSLIVGVEARLAKTDSVLLAFILLAQLAIARVFTDPQQRPRPLYAFLFWTAIGCGILVKGPVIVMVSGLTLLFLVIFSRSLKPLTALYPLRGLIWTLILVLPWFLAIWDVSGGTFFQASVGKDLLAKVGTGQEAHGAPPGTYLAAAFLTFWPGIALLLPALGWIWHNKSARPVGFLLAWAIPSWIVFEAVATKLPHYVMPLYPALALMAALAVRGGGLQMTSRWQRVCVGYVPFMALLLAAGLNAGFVYTEGHVDPYGLAACFIGALVVIAGGWLMMKAWLRSGLVTAALGIGIIYVTAFAWLLPRADHIWASDRLAEVAHMAVSCPNPTYIAVGYSEPSLVFQLGTDLQFDRADIAAATFRQSDCAVAMVDSRYDEAFVSALGPDAVKPVVAVEARNLNGFKPRRFDIYVRGLAAAPILGEAPPAEPTPDAPDAAPPVDASAPVN